MSPLAETLDALATHLGRQQGRARIVVWEHNSHIDETHALLQPLDPGALWEPGEEAPETYPSAL